MEMFRKSPEPERGLTMVDDKIKRLSEILKIIRDAGKRPVSGSYLARHFGISRVMISKYIKNLEDLGYIFDKRTGTGYALLKEPDSLHPVSILSGLNTQKMGRFYHYFREVGSTNDLAVSLALDGAPEGSCVMADGQTKGRGRLGRSWLSIPGKGIYMSLILRPDISPKQAPQLTLLAAIVLAETLNSLYGIKARVKWPNDVVVKEKKIAGILAESQIEPQKVRFVVIGIGINVHQTEEDFSDGSFRYPPTSIKLELGKGKEVARQEIVWEFLSNFERSYESYLSQGWETWGKKLIELSMLLGRYVIIDTGDEKIEGLACGFSSEGSLLLQLQSGEEKAILAGDVIHVTSR